VVFRMIFGWFLGQRTIPNINRIGASRHFDNRRRVAIAVSKVLGKRVRIDGCRGNDDFEVVAFIQQTLQIAQQEVDVQTAFVGLINDDDGILGQLWVVLYFRQSYSFSHELSSGVRLHFI